MRGTAQGFSFLGRLLRPPPQKGTAMRYLAMVLALVATHAHSTLAFKGDDFEIHLLSEKCSAPKVLSILKPEWVPRFQQGRLTYQGRTLQMCWTLSRPGHAVIVDEEGDAAEIPLSAFKEAPNT